jgi:NACalpha-BTF3-like transcription factor
MVKVEELHGDHAPEVHDESSSDSGDEMPNLEAASPEEYAARLNRSEKKARKAMAKLGMRPVEGVMRVTVKRSKAVMFVIARPEVYRNDSNDTYIIFGEAKVDDFGAAAAQAAQQFTHAPEVSKVAAFLLLGQRISKNLSMRPELTPRTSSWLWLKFHALEVRRLLLLEPPITTLLRRSCSCPLR